MITKLGFGAGLAAVVGALLGGCGEDDGQAPLEDVVTADAPEDSAVPEDVSAEEE